LLVYYAPSVFFAVSDRRVLIVDDDAGVRALVSEVLAAGGFTTREAGNADEALAAIREERPAVVVLDVEMPGRSGYELCRRLRAEFGNQLGIIFLSGSRTESFDRVAGLHLGADDYVLKPFEPDELVARVESVARRIVAPPAPARSKSLTERELEILCLLAEGLDQGTIATRLVITQKTVAKHIENILKKLHVHSRAEAVAVAYRERVLEPPAHDS
jgi:DNA-binding NarL/FixJ family response regulator